MTNKKKIIPTLLLSFLMGCATQYEVIEKFSGNIYHFRNLKNQEIKVILIADSLKVGTIIKKKDIRVIAEIEKDPE